MPNENVYQSHLIHRIQVLYPGCFVLKNDPNYLQGFPDLTVLYKKRWGLLEVKKSWDSPHRPNQEYYIEEADRMSFGRFIFPENEEEVLYELQQTFQLRRSARISKC